MWREIMWGRPVSPVRIAAVLLQISFLTFFCCPSFGQDLPPDIARIVEQMAEDGTPFEGMAEYYEALALRKPDINTMSRSELERTHLLSVFQIESLLEYRNRCGDILSAGELSLVDGFNAELSRRCALFMSFGGGEKGRGRYQNEIDAKVVRQFGSDGVSVAGKYRLKCPEHWSFGLAAENDAGEGFVNGLPDFISAFASYEGSGTVKRIVAGDYTVRAGQGLVVWKSFAVNSAVSPSSLMRIPSAATPYTSTDESAFFRGVALTLRAAGCEVSVFASHNALDANVVGDSLYTSIITGGYHRSGSELAKRHSMSEYVAGAALVREVGRWRFGVTGICYSYDRKNGRSVKDYNRFQQYDGWWGNCGADFFYHRGAVRLFGEVALDAGGGFATILGFLWNPVYELETSILARHYGKDYISTHGGAYSTLSSCSNQDGVTVSARWRFARSWTLTANSDYSYYPWTRYGIAGPSGSLKSSVSIGRRIGERSSVDFQCRFTGASTGKSFLVKADATVAATPYLSFDCKIAANGGGFAACAGFKASLFKRRLEVSGRFTGYSTDGYGNRIYLYEGNVPQTYSVRAFYGKGTGEYLMLKYSPARWLSVWIRVSENAASYFMRIFIPG